MTLGILVSVLFGLATGGDSFPSAVFAGNCSILLPAILDGSPTPRLISDRPRFPKRTPQLGTGSRACLEEKDEVLSRLAKAKSIGGLVILEQCYRGIAGPPEASFGISAPVAGGLLYTFCTLLL